MKSKKIRIVRPEIVVQIRGCRGFFAFLLGAIRCGVRVFMIKPAIGSRDMKPIYILAVPKYKLEALTDE